MACGRKCSPVPSPSPLQSPKSLPSPALPIIASSVVHSAHQFYVLRVVMTAIASVLGLLLILFVILRFLRRYFFWRRYYHNRRTRTNSPILFDVRGDSSFSDNNDDDDGPSIMHPIWFINTVGLQQSVIDSISMFKYRKEDGLVEGTECSVCLGEFQEDETLRILPKCTHAFHVQCIDTWLRSRKNCPLCRAPVIRENSVRDVTVVTVPEGGAHVENLDGGGGGGSFEVGGGESSVSELRVEEEEEEDGDDDGIVAIEDEEDCEVSDKNLGNGEKMMRVNRSVSVHSYDPSSTFEVPTQEHNSYSLHSF